LNSTEEGSLEDNDFGDQIEQALFTAYSDSPKDYKAQYRSILFNLKDTKNTWLKTNIKSGSITPDTLAKMSSLEMASEEMKKHREKIASLGKEAVEVKPSQQNDVKSFYLNTLTGVQTIKNTWR